MKLKGTLDIFHADGDVPNSNDTPHRETPLLTGAIINCPNTGTWQEKHTCLATLTRGSFRSGGRVVITPRPSSEKLSKEGEQTILA